MLVSLYFFCDSACAGCLSAIDSACPTSRTPWTQLYVYHVYVHIYDCTSIYGRRTCISTYGSYVPCGTQASIDRSVITGNSRAISLLKPCSITSLILYRLPWRHRLPPNSYEIASGSLRECCREYGGRRKGSWDKETLLQTTFWAARKSFPKWLYSAWSSAILIQRLGFSTTIHM